MFQLRTNCNERDQEVLTIKAAEKEALALSVDDPLICSTFQVYLRDNPATDIDAAIYDVFTESTVVRNIHQRWYGFITHRTALYHVDLQALCDALKATLRCVP